MSGRWRWSALGALALLAMAGGRAARASADVRLGKDFIAGIIEKLPPVGFERPGQYRGLVHSFRLIAIDSRSRQLLIACKIDGEFRAPVNGPISDRVARSPRTPEGWRRFGFDVRARVNVEPGGDAAPRFRIGIDEVKRRDLDGATGLVAKALGQLFDDLITQFANSRASSLGDRLNAEVVRRVAMFKEYGVFCGIEYSQNDLILHFDLTRLRGEGIVGYVFAEERPGTVPLYRWLHPGDRSHYYTIRPNAPDRPRAVGEGVSLNLAPPRPRGPPPRPPGLQAPGGHLLRLPRSPARHGAALPLLRPAAPAAFLHLASLRRIPQVGRDLRHPHQAFWT
jgi:hypothetical protein